MIHPDISIHCRDTTSQSFHGIMNGMRDLYFFLETRTLRFSKNYVYRLSAIWNRSVREGASERYELKNYSCLHTMISREPEVVSRRMKNRFKGQGSTLLTSFHSLTGSCYLRSYNGLNFSEFQYEF